MALHPFDWFVFRRTALAVAGAVATTAVLAVATDEATSTFGMRLARLAAFIPFASGVAALGVAAHVEARGEARTLSALGVPPWQAVRGAAAAGLIAGLLAVAALLSPWSDPVSLFPAARAPAAWVIAADRASAVGPGVRVDATGSVQLAGTAGASPGVEAPKAWDALPCVAPLALAVPVWAVTPMAAALRLATVAASGATAVFVLHGIAAGRFGSAFGLAAAAPLVLVLLSKWRPRRSR